MPVVINGHHRLRAMQMDNKARECKATVYPVGHTHNDIAACVDQWLSGYDKVTSRPVGHTHNDIDKRFSGYVPRTYKHRRCAAHWMPSMGVCT